MSIPALVPILGSKPGEYETGLSSGFVSQRGGHVTPQITITEKLFPTLPQSSPDAPYDGHGGSKPLVFNCIPNMEPNTSASAVPLQPPCSVLVSKDLMQVINPVKKEIASEHLTTLDNVLDSMKNYIIQHKLFDPEDPKKIIVKNNELGSIFGLSEFSIIDIKKILAKFVFPVSSKDKDSAEVICSYSVSEKALKRKLEVSEDIEMPKRLYAGCDSDESVYSVQDYETEFAKDTSDDNLCLVDENSFPGSGILTIEETYDVDVEYEIETGSDSNGDRNGFTTDSDSDIEEAIKTAILTFFCKTDSDVEYLADASSDENTNAVDAEISEEDKWLCGTCSTPNDPLSRRCASCWKLRCGWVSTKQPRGERNPRKHKPRSRKKHKKVTDVKNKESPSNFNQFDSPSTSQENLSSPSSSYTSEDGLQSSKSESDGKNEELNAKLCIICCTKPVNSSIIHGKTRQPQGSPYVQQLIECVVGFLHFAIL
ncbi:ranBP2-type domain-containing protein [Nephila pilipes]|uniref:RanBP2-type domain-containing protein n=1 Tax=Nephila pilipes TaxID=299642 RepID=A0A8X6NCM7_NEPPI|nr:ranBP2-type domain-containing protein [Nephila pilipes]